MQAKVLIVDDEPNILKALRRLLMQEDIETITAGSGAEGLEILSNEDNIGLIISDQRMPGMSGVEFLEKAKEVSPDSIRIVLTGYADINAAVGAINRGGAYRYLTKPWKDEEILSVVKEALEKYTLLQENKRLYRIVQEQNEELKRWNDQLEAMVREKTREVQKKNEELERLNERLRITFKSSITAISNLLELRDRKSRHHSYNVAEVSEKVALAMGLPDQEIEKIAIAALLHDIGKIGMPDILLQKSPEEMTEEELTQYKLHPVRGQTAIDAIEDLRDVALLVRHHHEWYDGSGFPDGLKAEEIPLGSRIIALSDFVDRTVNSIQKVEAVELTIKSLKRFLKKRFDPDLYPYITPIVTEKYKTFMKKADLVELEVDPKDLMKGMILSRDVKSGTGVLLLSKGVELEESHISAIRRYYRLDPPRQGVYVWVKR